MDPNLSAMLVCECVCVSPIMSFMLLHLENPVFNLCSWFPLCEKPVGPSQQWDQDRALCHGNVVEQKKKRVKKCTESVVSEMSTKFIVGKGERIIDLKINIFMTVFSVT